jgi:hypothetical protein
MIEEMASIEHNHNQTWSLVDWPVGQHAIGLKWVFKIKKGEHENITKHKARLVAKGYVHHEGIDYEEVFAQVTRIESMRVFLAVAAHMSWSVHHMDVKSAFLNGELAEEVYVQMFRPSPEPKRSLELRKTTPRAENCTEHTRRTGM